MRRILRPLTVAGLVALLAVLGGCDITKFNENPNEPDEAEPTKLLSNAQTDIANQYWRDYAGGFWIRYAQYWTTNQYTDADRYDYPAQRPEPLNNLFGNYYLALNDLQEVVRQNQDPSDAVRALGPPQNQIAIAEIMQAWTLKTMTDMWGPIPVEQALKGREQGEFRPAYNSQERVYEIIFEKLDRASENIDESATTLAGGDLVYGGDMSKWKKFANSLRLRAGITLADKKGDIQNIDIEAQMNEALAEGVFTSNDDNALFDFNTAPPYQNPFYENYEVEGRDDWAAPNSIVGTMNEVDDPRRSAYFSDAEPETSGDQFVGFPYGLKQGEAQSLFQSKNFSRPSERVSRTADAPCIFMLYDEVEFIKAEIALRSDLSVANVNQSGQQLYEDALEASARYWGVEDQTTINNWISRVPAVSSSNYEQVLGKQKWLAQYLQGVPGWTTFRRLDFEGVLTPPDGNPGQDSFGQPFAVRMEYPNKEQALNESNLTDAVDNKLGGGGAEGDNQGVLLWWDTTPPPTP